jgi:hypothetical protein
MSDLSINAKMVAIAVVHLGGEANLSEIYAKIRELSPEWPKSYKDDQSFEATVRHTIETYCPQSENWSYEREALFEKVDRGRYRTVPVDERPAVVARGRQL